MSRSGCAVPSMTCFALRSRAERNVCFLKVPDLRSTFGDRIIVSSYRPFILLATVFLFLLARARAESARPLASTQSPHGSLNMPCITCHTTADWKVIPGKIKFDHAQTGFSLRGRHTTVACRDCHADLKFANTPNK